MRTVALWCAAAVTAVLSGAALGACTGDPAPVGTLPDLPAATAAPAATTTTPATTTAAPERATATPVVPAPVEPAPLRPRDDRTPAGAVAFVRYFAEAYTHAYRTLDAEPLAAAAGPQCRYCAASVTDVRAAARDGGRIEGYGLRVRRAVSPSARISTGTVVVATVDQAEGRSVRADGTTATRVGFTGRRYTFALAWADNRWSVFDVQVER